MDPLSIAASAAGLVTITAQIGNILHEFVSNVRHVDKNMATLTHEVDSLSNVLLAIEDKWRDPLLHAILGRSETYLWNAFSACMDECKTTLLKLDARLQSLYENSKIFARGLLRKPIMGSMLNFATKDIVALKGHVQSHNSAMQSALAMINICLSLKNTSTQTSMNSKLEDIQASIDKMQRNLRRESTLIQGTPDTQEDSERITRNLQQLIEAAGSFHSNASSVLSNQSTISNRSILGDPLNEDQIQSIQNWIPNALESETETITQNAAQASETASPIPTLSPVPTPSSPDPTETAITESEPDHDSDTESDVFQSLYDSAISNFQTGNYARADMFLTKVISRLSVKTDNRINIDTARLMHAYICGLGERWLDVEEDLKVLTMSTNISLASCANHVLAISFLERAKIHEADGELAEAEACRALARHDQTQFDDSNSDTYLWHVVSREEGLRPFFVDGVSTQQGRSKGENQPQTMSSSPQTSSRLSSDGVSRSHVRSGSSSLHKAPQVEFFSGDLEPKVDNAFVNLLDIILSKPACRIGLSSIKVLVAHARIKFLSDPSIIDLSGNTRVIGYLETQSRGSINTLDFGRSDMKYVFLGDYFDMSADSIHTFLYLLAVKCKYPDRFFLIDGPRNMMSCKGLTSFMIEGETVLASEASPIFGDFVGILDCLPGAAVVKNTILITKYKLDVNFLDLSAMRRVIRPTRGGFQRYDGQDGKKLDGLDSNHGILPAKTYGHLLADNRLAMAIQPFEGPKCLRFQVESKGHGGTNYTSGRIMALSNKTFGEEEWNRKFAYIDIFCFEYLFRCHFEVGKLRIGLLTSLRRTTFFCPLSENPNPIFLKPGAVELVPLSRVKDQNLPSPLKSPSEVAGVSHSAPANRVSVTESCSTSPPPSSPETTRSSKDQAVLLQKFPRQPGDRDEESSEQMQKEDSARSI